MSYHKTKYDANHKEVAAHLRRVGVDVLELMKPLDLLCHRKGETAFVEVKIPGSAAKWTKTQLRFIADTKFNVLVAKSGDEASRKLRDRQYLSQRHKDSIAALLALNGKDYYTPSEIGQILDR